MVESANQANKVIIDFIKPNYNIRNINRDIDIIFESDKRTQNIDTIVLTDQGEIKNDVDI